MKKRYLFRVTLVIFLLGLAAILLAVFGKLFIHADSTSLVPVESSTLQSFLIFGGGMVGFSILLFIILANIG